MICTVEFHFVSTNVSPRWGFVFLFFFVYQYIAPMGLPIFCTYALPIFRPDGANLIPFFYQYFPLNGLPTFCTHGATTNIPPLWGCRYFTPAVLSTYRSYGATNLSPNRAVDISHHCLSTDISPRWGLLIFYQPSPVGTIYW